MNWKKELENPYLGSETSTVGQNFQGATFILYTRAPTLRSRHLFSYLYFNRIVEQIDMN